VADRAAVLAAMDRIDHLASFDGNAPTALIEAIRPDVYIKGADHDVAALPEARATERLGGRVVTVPLLPDRSTTGVIEACALAQRSSA
jgi:bifunctional ADP-heptose synthase (sugar kinase/adenylyltransferase)